MANLPRMQSAALYLGSSRCARPLPFAALPAMSLTPVAPFGRPETGSEIRLRDLRSEVRGWTFKHQPRQRIDWMVQWV